VKRTMCDVVIFCRNPHVKKHKPMALSNYYSGQPGQVPPMSQSAQPVVGGAQTGPTTASYGATSGPTGATSGQWSAPTNAGRPLGAGTGVTGSGTLRTWWFKIKTSIRRCLPPWNHGRTLA